MASRRGFGGLARGHSLAGGYRPTRSSLCTLLVVERGPFLFAGKLQGGLDKLTRTAIHERIRTLQTEDCPFANIPNAKQDPFEECVPPEDMSSFVWGPTGVASRGGISGMDTFWGSAAGRNSLKKKRRSDQHQRSTFKSAKVGGEDICSRLGRLRSLR